ncbi:glycosyltransferase family 4 protein [Anthocerotibacter panamensis]|uniref:glycosyltransferase family 4 protein n=1 Tax=Anthocerotibacter panamensis TaxID=2857077 RepID=UPI001C4033B5|nr:glycosyltransferase family 4 protein [Anthocerotibacter panamensis]
MRVLLIGNCQGAGGGPTHFQLLAKFLVAEGHRVFALGVGDTDQYLPQLEPPAEVLRIPQTATKLWSKVVKGGLLLQVRNKVLAFKPDLFIGIGYGNSYAYLAQLLGKNTFSFYQELITNPPYKDPLRMRLTEAFGAVAVQSPGMKPAFVANIPTDKPVGCLPCFSFSPAPGFRANAPSERGLLRLAYFGRLAANKGLPQFLRAFAQVQGQVEATFDIHGGGPESELIEQTIAKLQLGAAVKLCGPYPGGVDYARLLSSYHALVLPSIDAEGLPLVLLEAMSYGLPYLSTTIGAISDSARDNPDVLVVEPEQEQLAAGVVTLCTRLRAGKTDPARLQTYYQEHYSFEVMAQEWRTMLADPPGYFARQA